MNHSLSINFKGISTNDRPCVDGLFDLEHIWAKLQLGDQSHPEMRDLEMGTYLIKLGHF